MLRRQLTRLVWLSLIFLSACAGSATPEPASAPTTFGPAAPPADITSLAPTTTAVETTTTEPTPGEAVATTDDVVAGAGESSNIAEEEAAAAAETAVPPGNPENVSMVSPDGLQLLGTFYPAAGSGPWPAVLLLHMLGSDREAWAETGLPDALAGAGFAVLALDMRGHGDTGGTRDWARAEDDLLRVWRYLVDRGDVDPRRIAIVGASIGANLALRMGAREPFIPTVVLLSPGLDYQGVTTADTLTNFAGRPLLVVASSEDGYAADSSRTLAEQAGESAQLLIYDGAGHGTNMFGPQPDLIDVILDWLGDNL